MDEHRSAQLVVQRALVCGAVAGSVTGSAVAVAEADRAVAGAEGAAVTSAELERALDHVASCEQCSRRFDLAETAAWLESRRETHTMTQVPVDPLSLFERALTAALRDPEDLVRRRAAERLGEMTGLGAAAVEALAAATTEDSDERVRAAALTALSSRQRLNTLVSLPQWAVNVAPAKAASDLARVLAHLPGSAATTGVMRLESARTQYGAAVALFGERGVSGRVSREPDGLWLTVKGLPPEVENTKPVVAVPEALDVEEITVQWAGKEPGLITASEPVAGGSLRVRLGSVNEGGAHLAAAAAPPKLFDQIYLLHPKDRRKKV